MEAEIYSKTKKKLRMINSLVVNTPKEHMPLNFKDFFVKNILKFLKVN